MADFAPLWEHDFPGRLEDELDALKAEGVVPKIDQEWLGRGVLVLDFEWPLDQEILKLQAVFPDNYPWTRPEVYARELPGGRHVHPLSRGLCLIGRGTHRWLPDDHTLASLLKEQLPKIFSTAAAADDAEGVRDEDQQGEPAEAWWNGTTQTAPDSYCLIDSDWSVPPEHDHGTLTIQYVAAVEAGPRPRFRAYVDAVKDAKGKTLFRWGNGPLPPELRGKTTAINVPWARADKPPMPDAETPSNLGILAAMHPSFAKYGAEKLTGASPLIATMRCILYRTELGHRSYGDGWLFLLPFAHKRNARLLKVLVLRTFRAGTSDIGARVPAVASLRHQKVALFGLGAIGAPVAIDLARNGCGELRLGEFDIVEPGNTVRWPLGASAWGELKLDALASFIRREYPKTRIVPLAAQIGVSPALHDPCFDERRSVTAISRALDGIDLVIDMTAEQGINWILDEQCRKRGLPLINAHATPTLAGGVVARFLRREDDGCRMCLEYSWLDGTIPKPLGADAVDDDLIQLQPPGCNERTFTGASFDLNELSLEVVRLAVDTLSVPPSYPDQSRAHIVQFKEEDGHRMPPRWEGVHVRRHAKCRCHSPAS